MVEVIPAILEKEFPQVVEKMRLVEGLVEWVQIDIADGILVPNTTFTDLSGFKTLQSHLKREIHLMVKDPIPFIPKAIDAGFTRLFAHVEAEHTVEFVVKCQEADAQVGLAIDGPTMLAKIEPYLDNIDVVLVMAIEAGFSGRPFRPDTVEKIAKIREEFFDLPIAVDGAMNDVNAGKVIAAGATRICSNSYIFNVPNQKERIEVLKRLQPPEEISR